MHRAERVRADGKISSEMLLVVPVLALSMLNLIVAWKLAPAVASFPAAAILVVVVCALGAVTQTLLAFNLLVAAAQRRSREET